MEVTEILLELCGTTIDERALPLLKQRCMRKKHRSRCWKRADVWLREKSEQMVAALTSLIAALETGGQEDQG